MPSSASPSPFTRLLRSSLQYRRICRRASLYSVLNKIFDIAPEVLIGVAVDVVVQKQDSFLARLGIPDVTDQLLALALPTLVIWALESLFEYLYSLNWRNLAQQVQHELRIDAYRHVQSMPVSYFEQASAGGLVTVLSDDINQLERFLDGGANALIQVATTVVVIGGIFFYLAPTVAVLAMLPIPLIVFGAFRYQKIADPLYDAVRAKAAAIGGKLAANIGGITTIKSQVGEEFELASVTAHSAAYAEANRAAILISSAFIPIIRMAILAGFIATLILGGRMALTGELAVGSYGVLVFLTQRLLWPLTDMARTVDLYQRARASTDRVLALLAAPTETDAFAKAPSQGADASRAPHLPIAAARGAIELRGLGFAYDQRQPLFADLSLTLPAGSTTALVGGTGSGKSTIAKLLMRFYEPTAGSIRLGGIDLRQIPVRELRRHIGFVAQDVYLFDGTIRDNIAYGGVSADDAAVKQAAAVAHAAEFIDQLPQGYDTLVGERGVRLSGGQRQRLAIARAVLLNPPIMILDEATSAVDNESERLIQEALQRIAVGRTMLIIAHRLSTIRSCDQIYVLDHGRITEHGSHEELVAAGRQYAWLWQVQTGAPVTTTAELP